MTLVYCAFIILVSVEGEQLLLRSVVIRHQRDRLVRDLEQRNADVRTAMQHAEQSALARAACSRRRAMICVSRCTHCRFTARSS